MNWSVAATSLALLVLIAGEVFGQWNVAHYKKRKCKVGARDAFLENRKKKASFNTVVLFLLIVSSLLSLYSDIKEKNMDDESLQQLRNDIAGVGSRVNKIEKYLWPPIDPKINPKTPDDDPPLGPKELDQRMKQLNDKVDRLNAVAARKEELEEIREEIVKMRASLDSLKETIEHLEKYMAAPAGSR
ncbi:MAG: hypothetical protein HRU77_13770 [Gammaproteobacteria bacterium]|nr:MAG: hypothetical protein HRU77_13770 [Gammaproteobacteria bacterium]